MRTITQSTPAQAPDPAGPWQLRFWTIWTGQTLSLAGSALTQFVLIWWVTQTTQSTSALALAAVVALLPHALLGPIGGTLTESPSHSPTERSAGASGATSLPVCGLVTKHRGLLALYAVVTLMVMLIMPVFNLIPLFVHSYFAGDVNQVALMQGAGGVGLIGGGLLVFLIQVQRRSAALLAAYALACALIAGTALVPGSAFWLAVVSWALGASSFSARNAMLMALLQSQVPNALQGRVISLLSTMMALASPLGLGLVALLGSSVDVRAVFIVGGSAAAAVCLLGFAAPSLMRIEETAIGQETPGGHHARFD